MGLAEGRHDRTAEVTVMRDTTLLSNNGPESPWTVGQRGVSSSHDAPLGEGHAVPPRAILPTPQIGGPFLLICSAHLFGFLGYADEKNR